MKSNFRTKFSKEKLAKFFDKEGFYIVLFLCVCIVAITAVWVSRTGVKENEKQNIGDLNGNQTAETTPSKEASNSSDTDNKISAVDDAKVSKPVVQDTSVSKNANSGNTTAGTSAKVTTASKNFKLGSPIKEGVAYENIFRDYSPNDLVCFQYLNEWRTHGGIDVKAAEGTEVLAAGDGKVIDVKNDSTNGLGWVVTVDHNNGYRTIYANLGEVLGVNKNQTVKKGQKIGVVGNTSIYEKDSYGGAEADNKGVGHLHFEVSKMVSGKYESSDPKEYLTLQK